MNNLNCCLISKSFKKRLGSSSVLVVVVIAVQFTCYIVKKTWENLSIKRKREEVNDEFYSIEMNINISYMKKQGLFLKYLFGNYLFDMKQYGVY